VREVARELSLSLSLGKRVKVAWFTCGIGVREEQRERERERQARGHEEGGKNAISGNRTKNCNSESIKYRTNGVK